MNHSSRHREQVWEAAEAEGNGRVYCNLCHVEIFPGDDWDISHIGRPAALGGQSVGPAHRACNIKDNLTFVIPFVARAKRLRRRHLGITGPGLSDNPLPAGRRSSVTKKLNGKVEPRLSGMQKHARLMAERYPFGRSES